MEPYPRYFIFFYTFAVATSEGNQIQFGNIKAVSERDFPAWSVILSEIVEALRQKTGKVVPESIVCTGFQEMTEADFNSFNA